MIRRFCTLVALAAALFLVPAIATAEPWTHSISHEAGKNTSIKIVGSEGLQVFVEGRQDTNPALYALSDQVAFVTVELIAPDGTSWSQKVEVKQSHRTLLTVTYTPEPQKDEPAAEPAPDPIGRLTHDSLDQCRYVFMRDGSEVASYEFDTDGDKDVELPAGDYEVRVFGFSTMDSDWKLIETAKLAVSGDGWSYGRRDCNAP